MGFLLSKDRYCFRDQEIENCNSAFGKCIFEESVWLEDCRLFMWCYEKAGRAKSVEYLLMLFAFVESIWLEECWIFRWYYVEDARAKFAVRFSSCFLPLKCLFYWKIVEFEAARAEFVERVCCFLFVSHAIRSFVSSCRSWNKHGRRGTKSRYVLAFPFPPLCFWPLQIIIWTGCYEGPDWSKSYRLFHW